jgi:hypothetical protein
MIFFIVIKYYNNNMATEKIIIGITGKKRHGKDTLGDLLISKKNFIKFAFADPLKLACKEIFNFSDEQLYGNDKEIEDDFWKITPRQILQYVGTELFRNQIGNILPETKENIWIKVMEKKVESSKEDKIVITDVRFPNEVEMVKKLGGIVIKVVRPSLSIQEHSEHISEAIDQLDVDFTVINDKTPEDLYNAVIKIIENGNILKSPLVRY